jgi:hypothetical protein
MVIHDILGRIERHGLTVIPYFLDKEFYIPASNLKVNITPAIQPLTTDFLDNSEIESIYEHPERVANKESYKIHDRILNGCLCFGVKHEREIIAYNWCDLEHCNDKQIPFNLKKTEAYLFDMYTFKAYRGKNIAPYIRHQLYSHLIKMGRTDFFSITEVFNNPSLKFKRKLGAHPSKLYLNIKIGNFFKRNILLRSY